MQNHLTGVAYSSDANDVLTGTNCHGDESGRYPSLEVSFIRRTASSDDEAVPYRVKSNLKKHPMMVWAKTFIALLLPTLSAPFSVVVTGASGFLGTEIVHQLSEARHTVTAVCRERARGAHLEGLVGCKVTECDVASEPEGICNILETSAADYVINTAAVFRKDCTSFEQELVLPTLAIVENLVAACGRRGPALKRLVHTSSMASVRDPRQLPCNGKYYTSEDWNNLSLREGPWPQPYQYSKAESERLLWRRAHELGVDAVSMNPSMIYGPPRSLAASGAALSVVDLLKVLRGDGPAQSRLICDVRDVAAAHISALTAPLRDPLPAECSGGAGAGAGAGDLSNSDDGAGEQQRPLYRRYAPRRFILGPECRVAATAVLETLRGDPELAAHFGAALMEDATADATFSPAIPIGEREVDASPAAEDFQSAGGGGGGACRAPLDTVLDMARSLAGL
jgi:nucleoside-diphosphate-sugar epimerase